MMRASPTHAWPEIARGALRYAAKHRAIVLASVCFGLVLASLATGIILSENESRSRVLAALRQRGASSATFVSTFLSQQAARERDAAQRSLSGSKVSPAVFGVVASAFGTNSAILLDSRGRVLALTPSDRGLLGTRIAARYPHLLAAERGSVAVSNVVTLAVNGERATAIAVPFSSRHGRRVFSAAYGVSGSMLGAFVDHTISYGQHEVYLVDSSGRLVASSPRTPTATLSGANAPLAQASTRSTLGAVAGARTASTFTSAPVPDTPWRLVIEVPDSRLFASIDGWTHLIPWLIFALVSVIGALLVGVFARMTKLSREMSHSARTDSLTGLYNRRGLTEHLTRAAARARRREEPLSVLMIDLDRFKETNDYFGHAAGDQVLCALAECMREVLRADDVYGRWGGDEFLVSMPSTNEDQASAVAQRLRQCAAAIDLSDIGLPQGIQMSVGVATAVHTRPEEIVHDADVALYEAKAARSQQTSTDLEQLAAPR